MDPSIAKITALEILDSRGYPTLEVEVKLTNGIRARAAVPAGASTGAYEAKEQRDHNMQRYDGRGVLKAILHITEIIEPVLVGLDSRDQQLIDKRMNLLDGTADKSHLGANAILGVSLATARAAAQASNLPLYRYLGGTSATRLPVPMMNVINGGVHAQWQGSDFQEYMIVPYGAPSMREAIRWGSEVYHALQVNLKAHGHCLGVGDEGGFIPQVSNNEKPLAILMEAIEQAGFRPGQDIALAIDPAASAFFHDGAYRLHTEQKTLSAEVLIDRYEMLVNNYPLIVLEDGLAEDDWAGWQILTARLGEHIELVGDDLFVTNVNRIMRGIQENVANAVLIKLNQIGSLTEAMAAIRLAQRAGWGAMVSHRSGETVDSFLSDLSVAFNTGHLKSGAPARGERVEKYNQLLRIEEELGASATYAGKEGFVRGEDIFFWSGKG